jgi:TonB family protein
MIALNLHPAVGAPPDPPAGNRRGTFAATPEGRAGATGSPGSTGNTSGNGDSGASRKGNGTLPSGLYVGNTGDKSSPVAGNGSPANSVNPNLIASARPPRVNASRTMQPAAASKLSEPERAVFGNRRFYSLTLNLPNLNSGGGSWVIRFAELDHDSSTRDTADLSQPAATRKVDPAYPLELMRQNVAGTVILYAVIHADGSVGNVRVLRSADPRLDRFARENGTPVDIEATFQIPFRPAIAGSNF